MVGPATRLVSDEWKKLQPIISLIETWTAAA